MLQLYIKKQKNNELICSLAWDIIFTDNWNVLVWIFWRWKIWKAKKLMESQKVDGKIIFTDYWKVLVLNFSVIGNTVFFESRSWWKDDIYWFELLGDGKYGFFFSQKSWLKDDIYLVFLSIPWYSRAWEIWFFAQYK